MTTQQSRSDLLLPNRRQGKGHPHIVGQIPHVSHQTQVVTPHNKQPQGHLLDVIVAAVDALESLVQDQILDLIVADEDSDDESAVACDYGDAFWTT